MSQIMSTGKSPKQLIYEGVQPTNCGIPAGQIVEDGIRRYRWTHLKVGLKRGIVVIKNGIQASAVKISGMQWSSAVTANHKGDKAGHHEVDVYSAVSIIGSRFQGGFLMIKGSGWNVSAAGVYQVDTYQTGLSGTITRIYLNDPINGILGLGGRGVITPNPYYGCDQHDSAGEGSVMSSLWHGKAAIAGVTTCSAATSGYQLLQTRGPAVVHGGSSGIINAGETVFPYGSVVSTVLQVTKENAIGRAVVAGAKRTYFTADLFIE